MKDMTWKDYNSLKESKCVGDIPAFREAILNNVRRFIRYNSTVKCFYDGAPYNNRDFVLRIQSYEYDLIKKREEIIDAVKKAGAINFLRRTSNSYIELAFDISPKLINFYKQIDADKKAAEEAERKAAEEARKAQLNAISIDKYKPSQSVIDKIKNYRDKGSHVNVKAITDKNKLFTYYYAARLIGWRSLKWEIRTDGKSLIGKDIEVLDAMDEQVKEESSLIDTRNDFEKKYELPATNGLISYPGEYCWVPKKLLMYFIENNIPVEFSNRTPGGRFDRNGCQWTEIEHFTVYPNTGKSKSFNLAVHTSESGGPTKYTLFGGAWTNERVSIKQIIDKLDSVIEK